MPIKIQKRDPQEYMLLIHSGDQAPDSDRDLVRITSERISQEEVTKFVTDPSAGGVSIFLGTPVI